MQLYYVSLTEAIVGRVLDGVHNIAGTIIHDETLHLRADVFNVHIESISPDGEVVNYQSRLS